VNASSTHFYAQTARVELSHFRRTFPHPLGASRVRAFFLSSPVVIFLLKTTTKQKIKNKSGKKNLEIRSRTTSTHRLLDETVGLTDATTVLAVKVSAIFVLLTS